MNFDLLGDRRVPPWLIALVIGAVLWGLLGRSVVPGPVVSGWQGDGSAITSSVAEGVQQQSLTGLFQQEQTQSTGLASAPYPQDMPWGNPTDSKRSGITQGYGVGTHAPAATWGGLDIAIDGDGDGSVDPSGSMGAPVYATMSGVVELTPDTWPAGNHVWIKNGPYKVGYSHLKGFAVENGQTVKRGDLIAYMGSSGQSSGPHLDYQVWKDGANLNPLDFGAAP